MIGGRRDQYGYRLLAFRISDGRTQHRASAGEPRVIDDGALRFIYAEPEFYVPRCGLFADAGGAILSFRRG
jgi:hypothetical protein